MIKICKTWYNFGATASQNRQYAKVQFEIYIFLLKQNELIDLINSSQIKHFHLHENKTNEI